MHSRLSGVIRTGDIKAWLKIKEQVTLDTLYDKDNFDISILEVISKHFHPTIANHCYLLLKGAYFNRSNTTLKDSLGNTCLHLAILLKQDLAEIKVLCKTHPDSLTKKNNAGHTPRDLAVKYNQAAMPILLEKTTDLMQLDHTAHEEKIPTITEIASTNSIPLSHLPTEILLNILFYLPTKDLMNMTIVSQFFKILIDAYEEEFFNHLLNIYYPKPQESITSIDATFARFSRMNQSNKSKTFFIRCTQAWTPKYLYLSFPPKKNVSFSIQTVFTLCKQYDQQGWNEIKPYVQFEDLYKIDPWRRTCLHSLATNGHQKIRDHFYLLAKGKFFAEKSVCAAMGNDSHGNSLLHLAAALHQEPAETDFLVQSGADINAKNSAGNTPLHLAVIYRNPYASQFLEEHKAYYRILNSDRKSILPIAFETENIAVITTLSALDHTITISLLAYCIQKNKVSLIEKLIKHHLINLYDVSFAHKDCSTISVDPAQFNPFTATAKPEKEKIFNLLVDYCLKLSDKNEEDKKQKTCLLRQAFYQCILTNYLDGLEKLLRLKVSPNFNIQVVKSEKRLSPPTTPLNKAILLEHEKQVTLLLKFGANYNLSREGKGWTALHYAAFMKNINILAMLIPLIVQTNNHSLFYLPNKKNHIPLRYTLSNEPSIEAFTYLLKETLKAKKKLSPIGADIDKMHFPDINEIRFQEQPLLHFCINLKKTNKKVDQLMIQQLLTILLNPIQALKESRELLKREKAILQKCEREKIILKEIQFAITDHRRKLTLTIINNVKIQIAHLKELSTLLSKCKANLNLANKEGKTPLLLAIENQCEPFILNLLLNAGADPECAFLDKTCLCYATTINNKNAVETLLMHDANPFALMSQGIRAIPYFTRNIAIQNLLTCEIYLRLAIDTLRSSAEQATSSRHLTLFRCIAPIDKLNAALSKAFFSSPTYCLNRLKSILQHSPWITDKHKKQLAQCPTVIHSALQFLFEDSIEKTVETSMKRYAI